MMTKKERCGALVMFAAMLWGAPVRAEHEVGRILRSPPAGHSTSNYVWYDAQVQMGGMVNWLRLEYDYFVDSEPGKDFFVAQYSTNGGASWVTASSVSGRAHDRHAVNLPVGWPTVRIRFGYLKDIDRSGGMDTAWVDDVLIKSAKGVIARFDFDDLFPGELPFGWSGSGSNGGWRSQRHLATRSYGPPNDMPAGHTSYVSRNINFPFAQKNRCVLHYYLDAGSNDYFRVWDNGTKIFEVSGANKGGRALLDVVDVAGNHTLKLEYVRGASAPAGLNMLRVRSLSCRSGDDVIQHYYTDGERLGLTPAGWTSGCTPVGSCGTWRVSAPTPHRMYVPKQGLAAAPVVDGEIGNAEYRPPSPPAGMERNNLTITVNPHYSSTAGRQGRYGLFAHEDPIAGKTYLYVVGQVQADTESFTGDESGQITILYDASRSTTLARAGCASGQKQLPDGNDRRITFSYALASGASSQTIASFDQQEGSCGAWQPLLGAPLGIAAAIADNGGDRISFEIRIELESTASSESMVGLAVTRSGTGGATSEMLPYSDAAVPSLDDAYSWETIHLASPVPGTETKIETSDGCCLAEWDRI